MSSLVISWTWSLFVVISITLTTTVLQIGGQGQESLCQTIDGHNETVSGFCINIKSQLKLCPSHYALLKNKDWVQLRKHICSSDNKRVCCPIDGFNEIAVTEEERLNGVNFGSHPSFQHLPSLRTCGLSFHSSGDRIIGGNKSLPGEFPWVVRIGMRLEDEFGSSIHYTCGGSIISKRYILTAAHCFKQPDFKLDHVRLGQSDEDKEEECIGFGNRRRKSRQTKGHTHAAHAHGPARQFSTPPIACAAPIDMGYEELIVHPEYTREVGSVSDIALIRLSQDIDTSSYFTKPICLPFLNEYNVASQLGELKILRDNKTLVAGFGKVNNDEQIGSSSLQFVRSPIQPSILCRISYPNFNITPSQICAGGTAGSGSCLGDSGGPLFLPATPEAGPTRSLRSFLLGIVSYGKTRCAQGNEPVVYTKVRSHLKWILDNIRA